MEHYLVFQAHGEIHNLNEMMYSLMTFLQCSSKETIDKTKIVIYTDNDNYLRGFLRDLPQVSYENLSKELVKEWKGDINFIHRVKIKLLEHFFLNYKGKALYVDTDTSFKKDIGPIFDEINDQTVVMHVMEGLIDSKVNRVIWKTERFVKKHSFKREGIGMIRISTKTAIWNAGVLGLMPSHAKVFNDVIDLTESIYRLWDLSISEQLSFSYFLAEHNEIKPASEYIHHYWYFKEFKEVCDAFFEHHKNKSILELVPLASKIDPVYLEKPKVEYRKLSGIKRFIKRKTGVAWEMPAHSFE